MLEPIAACANTTSEPMASAPSTAVRASDLFVLQGRLEHVPGDGAIVKPANAAFVGMRVEGGGAVKTTVVALAILAVLEAYLFFGGGND